jgi:hypothetical protein
VSGLVFRLMIGLRLRVLYAKSNGNVEVELKCSGLSGVGIRGS